MTTPTDADRARARKLLDELTFGGHSQDGAESVLATALAEERAPFLALAGYWDTDGDARFSQNRIARSVAAREIRRVAREGS